MAPQTMNTAAREQTRLVSLPVYGCFRHLYAENECLENHSDLNTKRLIEVLLILPILRMVLYTDIIRRINCKHSHTIIMYHKHFSAQ